MARVMVSWVANGVCSRIPPRDLPPVVLYSRFLLVVLDWLDGRLFLWMERPMKSIETLVADIYEVVKGNGGWDKTITKFMAEGIANMAEQRFQEPQKPRNYLGLSSIGQPCKRKLWFKVNRPELGEELSSEALGTFFYGDLLEYVVIAMAMAAGHRVEGLQEELVVGGIKGHGDVVIDGWVVDVKSASRFGFEKFRAHKVKEDDPFGYISQLSSYLYGYRDNPIVHQKNKAAFLVVQKDRFKLCLDVYDFTDEIKNKEQEVKDVIAMSKGPMPDRGFAPIPDGKSGNMKLPTGCSYCEYRNDCWDNLRTFIYSTGPRFLTKVVNTPKVMEVT